MRQDQTLPHIWLISDERNDRRLERALMRLPRGSGFIYRHYHLDEAARWERFQDLLRISRGCDHWVILADSALTAREWGADGTYGAPLSQWPRRRDMIHLATVHDMSELRQANLSGANAALISPVFTTRSHPGAEVLGPARFRLLAKQAQMPVIALGGMTWHRARALNWKRWAAIDGLR